MKKTLLSFLLAYMFVLNADESTNTDALNLKFRELAKMEDMKDHKSRVIDKSKSENHRNQWVDIYLEKRLDVRFPEGDYLFIADQPMGYVSQAILIDFDKDIVNFLPGHHYLKLGVRNEKLTKPDKEYILRFLDSDLLKDFPSKSGMVGMDGGSIVVYYRRGNVERFMSHWSPEHVGMYMFLGVFKKYERRQHIEKERLRQHKAEQTDGDN